MRTVGNRKESETDELYIVEPVDTHLKRPKRLRSYLGKVPSPSRMSNVLGNQRVSCVVGCQCPEGRHSRCGRTETLGSSL